MKTPVLSSTVRTLLVICAILLIAVLFVPMWRIDLDAPQYPEGLRLLIYPHKLGGNVDIINGLNHYIGMKTLHNEDFIEFTLLPYIIGFFALCFLVTAFVAKRKWLYVLFVMFVSFGVIAMVDFWRWEYNYGHNLDPNAAIVVPGMAYQPPLIGFKQLLNFGAYSIPDIGGWLFISVGVILLFVTGLTWKNSRKKGMNATLVMMVLFTMMIGLASCTEGPDPIKVGKDYCSFCKMTITDIRFAAEFITSKQKVYKFDDIKCMKEFTHSGVVPDHPKNSQLVVNYCLPHQMIPAQEAKYVFSERFKSPMGGNIAAFNHADSLALMKERFAGKEISWSEIKN